MTVYAHINTVPHGSTGSLMMKEHYDLLKEGHDSYVFWGRGREASTEYEMKFCSDFEVKLDVLQTRLDDRAGFHSTVSTKRLLDRLDSIDPDVVHLHNLHGYYINVQMLFNWLIGHHCRVEWTLHDCWAFTGHCAHFSYVGCQQWKDEGCSKGCPQLDCYPKTYNKTNCSNNYLDKKELFTSIPHERMLLICPSMWLANLVRDSFLGKYRVAVRYNTIDRSVFRPIASDVKSKIGLAGKTMVLGVANPWTERKGLLDFFRLSRDLDNEKYGIVLVGLNEVQLKQLPPGIIGIKRTESKEELAAMYSAADIFFNPTYEDNYPTVNLEAEACGTVVITYDTGGCAETIVDPRSKVVATYEDALCEMIGK